MWNGIATRHADTIDTKFFLWTAKSPFSDWRTKLSKDFREPAMGGDLKRAAEASHVAAVEYLRERLEEEDERPLYDVSYDDVLRVIDPCRHQVIFRRLKWHTR